MKFLRNIELLFGLILIFTLFFQGKVEAFTGEKSNDLVWVSQLGEYNFIKERASIFPPKNISMNISSRSSLGYSFDAQEIEVSHNHNSLIRIILISFYLSITLFFIRKWKFL